MPISTKSGDIAFASILSGAYASAAIALFFLVADALGGRILHTPSLMGQVVLFNTAPANVTTVRLDALAIYSVVHLMTFIGIGSLVTKAYSRSMIPGSGPGLFVFTLGLLTVGTMAVDRVFYPGIIDAIGRLPLALGNGTASATMTAMIYWTFATNDSASTDEPVIHSSGPSPKDRVLRATPAARQNGAAPSRLIPPPRRTPKVYSTARTQSSRFASLFFLSVLSFGALEGQTEQRTILSFEPDAVSGWFAVNDGVMGGVSSSRIRPASHDIAIFEGHLSLENNGGFASVRTPINEGALSKAAAVVLTVRGDGKRYQLRLRMGRNWDGVAYAVNFETTADTWTTIEIPLEQFQPMFRGFVPRNARALNPSQVQQIGLMMTDKQEGPFRLEISKLDATIEP